MNWFTSWEISICGRKKKSRQLSKCFKMKVKQKAKSIHQGCQIMKESFCLRKYKRISKLITEESIQRYEPRWEGRCILHGKTQKKYKYDLSAIIFFFWALLSSPQSKSSAPWCAYHSEHWVLSYFLARLPYR